MSRRGRSTQRLSRDPADGLIDRDPRISPSVSLKAPNVSGESRWYAAVSVAALLLSLVPYLAGFARSDGRVFLWLGSNIDDSCVYLAWMRQAAAGSLRALNLFTTDAQRGMALNPLFLVLGRIAAWTHLPLIGVYQGARLALGAAMLLAVRAFLERCFVESRVRKMAFLLVCFSAGLGWLPIAWPAPINAPIDTWQGEAITFLSLYLSPLFCAALALQVAIITLLFDAYRTGSCRRAVLAGLCGLVLGVVHSYDVISLSAVWLLFLLTVSVLDRSRRPAAAWLHALIAGGVTAPAVAYVYWQYRTEPVFRARADVATLSPALYWVLLGYGATLLLALLGAWLLTRSGAGPSPEPTIAPQAEIRLDNAQTIVTPSPLGRGRGGRWVIPADWLTDPSVVTLLIVWAVANVAISYLPHAAFQRKLLQGAHFPIAMLAAVALARILSLPEILSDHARYSTYAGLAVLILGLSNVEFLYRDVLNYSAGRSQTGQHRPYVQPGEIEALDWVAANSPESVALQPLPWLTFFRTPDGHGHVATVDTTLACIAPGRICRKVYCGHWGETPNYATRLNEIGRLFRPDTSDNEREAILTRMRVGYLIFSQKDPADASADDLLPMLRGRAPLPPYLTLVHSNPDADVYRIDSSRFPSVAQIPIAAPGHPATRAPERGAHP